MGGLMERRNGNRLRSRKFALISYRDMLIFNPETYCVALMRQDYDGTWCHVTWSSGDEWMPTTSIIDVSSFYNWAKIIAEALLMKVSCKTVPGFEGYYCATFLL